MTAQWRWFTVAIVCGVAYFVFDNLAYLIIACTAVICLEVRDSR